MEQSKCLLQGPRNAIPGPLDMISACYLPLTGQAPHGQPRTGQQASCSSLGGHMLPRCITPGSVLLKKNNNKVKRGRVWGVFFFFFLYNTPHQASISDRVTWENLPWKGFFFWFVLHTIAQCWVLVPTDKRRAEVCSLLPAVVST